MENQLPQNDHDMLVTLHADVRAMRDEFRVFNVAVTTQGADHETRLRQVESTYVSWPKILAAIVAWGTLMAGIGWLIR